jgi:ABC-type amino acid transport substrate-binding protein
MKSLTKLMIAAAALAVATGAASAQTMTADIPFAFRAGDQVLPAGEYRVEVTSPHNLVILSNFKEKRSAILIAQSAAGAPKDWRAAGTALMSFECGASRCTLTQMWSGYDTPVLNLPHGKRTIGEPAPLTLIRLVRTNGK